MTEHIKQQINEEAVKQYPEFSDTIQELDFIRGANFGYGLAEQEITRLKELIKQEFMQVLRGFGHDFQRDKLWLQFQTDNNL
jgi:hypothetical protein